MALKNKKSLGQHWLKDRIILDSIAEMAHSYSFDTAIEFDEKPSKNLPVVTPSPNQSTPASSLCVEIGPGLGTLTSALLRVFDRVLAIEFDEKLAKNLPASFPGKNLEVVNQDILKFDFATIREPYVVAGNIPYYITSPILDLLLHLNNPPERIVLLIQKEVAERLTKKHDKNSVLSLTAENRAKVEYGFDVPRQFFTPPPKVDSAVVVLEPRKTPEVPEKVIDLIRQGFKNPRKKLTNSLPQAATTEYKDLRPADLSLKDWENLEKLLSK